MSRTNYTGVSKDDVTGKYLYYFKSGVDRATGKPYQERKRGFETAKEAHEARIHAMKKVHDMRGGSILRCYLKHLSILYFYLNTMQGLLILKK